MDLHNRKYLDFLEFLMQNTIVENLDFFDPEVYSDDVEDLDQTKEEEGDPSEFEKKKDLFNIYENDPVGPWGRCSEVFEKIVLGYREAGLLA